jgi:hypothetical protein
VPPDGFDLALEEERDATVPGIPGELVWELPRHGEALESCQRDRFRGHRADDGVHFQVYKADCGRFVCPKCDGYIRRAAHAIEDQVLAWLPVHRPAVHVTVSPPQDARGQLLGGRTIATTDGFRRLRSEAYAALKARGVERGALVFHPLRIARPGVRYTCAPGPHFHCVGIGQKTNLGVAYERDGWVGKYLGSRKRVYRTAVYILSHAGRAAPAQEGLTEGPGRSPLEVVTWFGYHKGERRAPERTEGVFCAICELVVPLSHWYELIWEGSGPPPTEDGVAVPGEWRAVTLDRTCWPPLERDITGSVFVPTNDDHEWAELLERNACAARRASGEEEVQTRDPSLHDKRAWGDPMSPSDRARWLKEELDRLEKEP